MNIDKYGLVEFSVKEIFNELYNNTKIDLSKIFVDDPRVVEQFNAAIDQHADSIPKLQVIPNIDQSIEEYDRVQQRIWFMPKDYCPDLYAYLFGLCKTPEQIERVNLELDLFRKHGMIELLYYLKYLVDTMQQNNIVWGVGRGSSVASYVLYLMDVHQIDSLKYNLDIEEFLKP